MPSLDDESKQFLEVCRKYGGKARSDVIRRETGMSKGQRDRRFEKLEDRGYILIQRADEPLNGGGIPPRIAVLTDQAQQAIADGLLEGDEDELSESEETVRISVGEFEEFSAKLDALENRVNALAQAQNGENADQVENVTGDVSDDLREVKGSLAALEEDVEAVQELDEQMEYVYKWMGTAEKYAKASRYLFEQMGLSFDAAIEDVEAGNDETEFSK